MKMVKNILTVYTIKCTRLIAMLASAQGTLKAGTSVVDITPSLGLGIFKNNFTISFANGSYGYLATPAQHELGVMKPG